MEMISKMTESWIVDDDVSSSDGVDLSTWELINPSDSDSETLEFPETDTDTDSFCLSRSPPKKKPIVLAQFGCNYYNHNLDRLDICHVDGDGDDDDGESGDDDVDDELVPKGFGVRLGRDRMRKLGKREYSKMARLKKLPLVYNRPGCVRGKHGLGLKHSLM